MQRTLLLLLILDLAKPRFKKCCLLSNNTSVFARVQIKSGNVFLLLSGFISSFNLHFSKHMRELVEFYLTCSIVHNHVIDSLFSRQAQTTRVWQEILLGNKPGGMETFT